ncbi:titin [Bicyclus anynana]|uniref:Titin n=1 Tax=Bicyclus anynana TaxID=110368 RepID=A0ABM3M2M5_BICAN|nr:titin [Bicyclus anynana]
MDPGEGSSKKDPARKDSESSPSSKPIVLTGKIKKFSKLTPPFKPVDKKRVCAFSIQKKTPISPIVAPKAIPSSNATPVIIGKLSGVKVAPKPEPDPELKRLKPPKPGSTRKSFQDSYIELQKRTLSEIEDIKRKMELVELGIPLGLICPTSTSETAMPTKAMPPIKSFLDPTKVDELIREAKKAKEEGRKYKFDYQKLLPGYDNPFQKKKDELERNEKERRSGRRKSESERDREREKDRRRSDKHKRSDHKKDSKHKDKSKERKHEEPQRDNTEEKETDVNLNDYLVCDSWSLENDDKNSTSSPKVPDKPPNPAPASTPSVTEHKNNDTSITVDRVESPKNVPAKLEKLQPVIDSFKYEIDDDEILDIFDENCGLDRYAQQTKAKKRSFYDSPDKSVVDYDQDNTKDSSMDGLNEDTFLESVINEIKQETLSDETSQDRALVEYEMSPNREESPASRRSSVTPELDDKVMNSQRSNYSEGGYRSSDSYKSIDTMESGYKSVESFRLSVEKELDEVLERKMSKSTVDSLETWSFVLKICQPLLFRHDKKKCYKETRMNPKLWYAANPKSCDCVKDRSVVYEELEMCKMALVDRVYGCDQIPDAPFPKARKWYPQNSLVSMESTPLPLTNEWEAEDSQMAERRDIDSACTTPQRNDEMSLDREYQRFMEAVWPDVIESKKETSRSTTPVRQESRKKKKEESEKEAEEKKPKKIKLSSEGWSQESDMEEEDKSKKQKNLKEKSKSRKRKHSTSTLSSVSETDEEARRRKLLKKKAIKKAKSKSAKRRRMGRKLLKKLKEKQKKRNKVKNIEEEEKKKEKKAKKKKQLKLKKKEAKKKKHKAQSSSSSSSSSDSSDTESGGDRKSKKAKKKAIEEKKKAKKMRQSSSDSAQSFEEELFDVNILNNIKTERLTDDEKAGHKMMEFSPRRQKPREIIDVKELQNDFVENVHIKQEVEETPRPEELPEEVEKAQEPKVAFEEDSVSKTDVANIDLPKPSPQTVESPQDVPPSVPSVPSVPPSVPSVPSVPSSALSVPDESNTSQASSQESVGSISLKDAPIFYEKDESHLRPSSQNSNYSFNDVISASQNSLYQKGLESSSANQISLYDKEVDIKVEPSLYPNEIGSLSGDYKSTNQSDYAKISANQSDYAKISANQSDYAKISTNQIDYNKLSANHSDYSKVPAGHDYSKRIEVATSDIGLYDKGIDAETECEDKYAESYEAANYEMYEQMAMAYQSDVASQQRSSGSADGSASGAASESRRIETVVGARAHGEIKCDWRASDAPTTPRRAQRPSRWGLKPGEVNIVLTGDGSQFQSEEPVYRIQSLANRTDVATGYDEAYMDMYGAADRLQYGDCFGDETDLHADIPIPDDHPLLPAFTPVPGNVQHISPNIVPIAETPVKKESLTSLDVRINKVLQETVLGGIANEIDSDSETADKGKSATAAGRAMKRVSFADGYKPGQDSDVEEPPVKKRKRARRTGCAWPCPATHPDHVPLWDALPPPPPPPGSPPPRAPPPRAPPHAHLLRAHRAAPLLPTPLGKFDPTLPLAGFMPPEPPPGLIALQ